MGRAHMHVKDGDFGFLFWLHLAVIAGVWTSPWWANWKFVLAGMVVYYGQNLVLGGCVLTKLELRDKDESFYHHYLRKAGVKWSARTTLIITDGILPSLIAATAILLQTT